MYRVYDKKKNKFVQDNIFLTPEGDLVESKRSIFGNKLTFIDQNRFVYQKSIDLYDKNKKLIFVGDYIKAQVAEDREIIGVVTFAEELSAYIILCFETDEFFTLGTDVCEFIEIIGNVFREPKESKKDKKNDWETLQE